jgi:DNA-directed RNA polymerase
MTEFSGWQYLLIDVANQYGHDKMLFEERIKWAEENLDQLESLVDQAETKPLYMKGVQAIRKAQKGIPTGHLIGFDACCSGVQIMSAITGCIAGATATGLVDPNVRADAYSTMTETMNELLHSQGITVDVSRQHAKEATMTSF